jgi:hypothetical protein
VQIAGDILKTAGRVGAGIPQQHAEHLAAQHIALFMVIRRAGVADERAGGGFGSLLLLKARAKFLKIVHGKPHSAKFRVQRAEQMRVRPVSGRCGDYMGLPGLRQIAQCRSGFQTA